MRVGGQSEQVGERCPPGVQVAVLVGVYDLGMQVGFEQKIQPKVALAWESQQRDTKGRPFVLYESLTNSSNEKATLTARYGALAGKTPTEEECAEGFDMDLVVGKACFLNVVPPKKQGGWPRIDTVMPLPVGMPPPQKVGKYDEIPKFVTMMLSKAITGQGAAPAAVSPQQPKAPFVPAKSLGIPTNPISGQPLDDAAVPLSPDAQAAFDSEIPF